MSVPVRVNDKVDVDVFHFAHVELPLDHLVDKGIRIENRWGAPIIASIHPPHQRILVNCRQIDLRTGFAFKYLQCFLDMFFQSVVILGKRVWVVSSIPAWSPLSNLHEHLITLPIDNFWCNLIGSDPRLFDVFKYATKSQLRERSFQHQATVRVTDSTYLWEVLRYVMLTFAKFSNEVFLADVHSPLKLIFWQTNHIISLLVVPQGCATSRLISIC
mmetsp:Transcript_34305/g.83246  ORF Transcript_34305/g.83246 Transcript_34305/m.83246 type:complete len:216 (+) Transcript_34305:493-1140(+)